MHLRQLISSALIISSQLVNAQTQGSQAQQTLSRGEVTAIIADSQKIVTA
jgi:hypothetical protein